MGSVFNSTKTVKKIDKPAKNIASFQRKSVQRETGSLTGRTFDGSQGGSASGSTDGHSKGGNRQTSGSTGNKAGNMAAGDTGNLAGMSGVTGNQRSNYKRQMAKVRMEQSKKVTCAAGQKNANAMASAGVWSPDMTQDVLQSLPLLTPEMLALLAALAPWLALFVAGVMVVVYMPTITHEVKRTKRDGETKVLKGDVLDANGRVIAKARGGAPNPNRNNKKLAKDILRTAIQTKNVMFSCLSGEEKQELLSLLDKVRCDWKKRYKENENTFKYGHRHGCRDEGGHHEGHRHRDEGGHHEGHGHRDEGGHHEGHGHRDEGRHHEGHGHREEGGHHEGHGHWDDSGHHGGSNGHGGR